MKLADIAWEGKFWRSITGRRPFFNYCVHERNGTEEDADRLAVLFTPDIWEATISVICERNDGLPATSEHQRNLAVDFSNKLLERGFNVRVFDPAGQDTIGGGCGQLWFVQKWFDEHPDKTKKTVGFGKPVVHAPTSPFA